MILRRSVTNRKATAITAMLASQQVIRLKISSNGWFVRELHCSKEEYEQHTASQEVDARCMCQTSSTTFLLRIEANMELLALADRISNVKRKVAAVVESVAVDKYQANAFAFISNRLEEMEIECRSSKLKPATERHPEIGRIAEETDPAILPPDVGGELIAVERAYQRI